MCDFCLRPHLTEDCNLTIEEKHEALYKIFKCRRYLESGHKEFFVKQVGKMQKKNVILRPI